MNKSMNKSILFVDICNTIANVNAELAKQGIHTDLYPACIPEKEINWELAFRDAAPIEPVVSMVREFSISYQVVYLTARDNKTVGVTMKWLQAHNLPKGPIIHTRGREKGKFVAYHGDRVAGIIEDSPKEIESVRQARPDLPIYIPQWGYNRHVEGRRIEIHKPSLVEQLKNLQYAINDLSLYWSKASDEIREMLEHEYPFDQSFDELACMMNHWVGNLLHRKGGNCS